MVTGRFISEDPIGFAGGINRYAYAGNSPINHRDQLGLQFDFWNNPVMDSVSHLPAVCEGGLFNFAGGGTQGGGEAATGFYGAFQLQDASISLKGRKPKLAPKYSEGILLEGGATVGDSGPKYTAGGGAVYEPNGSSGFALTEGLVFG